MANAATPGGFAVSDQSSDGIQPDPTLSSPTIVACRAEQIAVATSTGRVTQTGAKRFRVPIVVQVSNPDSTTSATNVQLTDDLAQAFPGATVSIVSPLLLDSCTRPSALALSPLFDGQSHLELLTGDLSLNPLESCTLTFVVEVDFGAGPFPATALYNAVIGTTAQTARGSELATARSEVAILFRPAASMVLTKTTPLVNVSTGHLVPYTIAATSLVAMTFDSLEVRDVMPAGFQYRMGSASVDGLATEPRREGRTLIWPALAFAANGTRTIHLALVVGSGVEPGEYSNLAQAFDPRVPTGQDPAISLPALATVRVVPEPTFACSDLVGRVFDDRNGNGAQDAGEVGLPAVRLATARGWLVMTDDVGRYHIACAATPDAELGSNFILKVDARTLPSDYVITGENPRTVRLTAGKMTVLDFGARRDNHLGRVTEDSILHVRINLDPLTQAPVLNVMAETGTAARNEDISFFAYTNYAAWITRSELRIFLADQSPQADPLVVVPAGNDFSFDWTVTAPSGIDAVSYVLRVYGADGKFDETEPRRLELLDRPVRVRSGDAILPQGYDENHRAVANIMVQGGSITVNGDSTPGAHVRVMGRNVAVADGRFVSRQIVPAGTQVVSVTVTDSAGVQHEYTRDMIVPRHDWFSVAILDLTLGQNWVSGPAGEVTGDPTGRYKEELYTRGRVAFYAKGRFGSNTRFTASADTREEPLEDLVSNFSRRDPRSLLRRLDPNTYYPTYGDDGTLEEDAPTQGNLYVKLERNDSRIMWGSFQARPFDTDLISVSRGLYGAELDHRGLSTTRFGERKTELRGFAADPGTIASREEFRGTGGSLYYLRHQDIVIGSEQVRVEIRDRESQIVLASTLLQPGQDYELNALQGRVSLREPLSAIADRQTLVRDGTLDGNPVVMVVTYEFAPGLSRVDNLTSGGRLTQWWGDHLRLGATAYRQDGTGMEQTLLGGDFILRHRAGTYFKVERARSDGPGNQSLSSISGGFGFTDLTSSAQANTRANATRAEAAVDLSELSGRLSGTLTGYYADRDAGFSSPGQLTSENIRQSGFAAQLPLASRMNLSATVDFREGETTGRSHSLELNAGLRLTSAVTLSAGIRDDDRVSGLAGGNSHLLSQAGERTDVIGRLELAPMGTDGAEGRFGIYGLAQATVNKDGGRSENDRFGLGGRYRMSRRLGLKGEVTDGDGGRGGLLGADLQVREGGSVYLNYLVDADERQGGSRIQRASLITGTRLRYSDATSVFAERRQQSSHDGGSGLMHAFGVDIAAGQRWSWGLKYEHGVLGDSASGDIARTAASLNSGYHGGGFTWSGAVEYRTDKSDIAGRREAWLIRNTAGLQASRDWRFLGTANLALGDHESSVPDAAKYVEVAGGLAYRPVHSNRLNGLFRYTYLYDLASPGQLSGGLRPSTLAQRSHIVSMDGTLALTRRLSLGGKAGYRAGSIRDNTLPAAPWLKSNAWLTLGRLDWRLVRSWEMLGEVRSLTVQDADVRSGMLFGVYRHLTDNLKVGAGYNFTDYSDDLTDLSYRNRGIFLNLVGQQ
ncbi:MAG: OmpA family protein [Gemmatimonadota bacterium]